MFGRPIQPAAELRTSEETSLSVTKPQSHDVSLFLVWMSPIILGFFIKVSFQFYSVGSIFELTLIIFFLGNAIDCLQIQYSLNLLAVDCDIVSLVRTKDIRRWECTCRNKPCL